MKNNWSDKVSVLLITFWVGSLGAEPRSLTSCLTRFQTGSWRASWPASFLITWPT